MIRIEFYQVNNFDFNNLLMDNYRVFLVHRRELNDS
jgi:hypothetical protein